MSYIYPSYFPSVKGGVSALFSPVQHLLLSSFHPALITHTQTTQHFPWTLSSQGGEEGDTPYLYHLSVCLDIAQKSTLSFLPSELPADNTVISSDVLMFSRWRMRIHHYWTGRLPLTVQDVKTHHQVVSHKAVASEESSCVR